MPALWLIYCRMWIELVLFIGLFSALLRGCSASSDAGQALLGWPALALFALFAFEANDLRGAALERRGYRRLASARAQTATMPSLRFFADLAATAGKADGRGQIAPPQRPRDAEQPGAGSSGEART